MGQFVVDGERTIYKPINYKQYPKSININGYGTKTKRWKVLPNGKIKILLKLTNRRRYYCVWAKGQG